MVPMEYKDAVSHPLVASVRDEVLLKVGTFEPSESHYYMGYIDGFMEVKRITMPTSPPSYAELDCLYKMGYQDGKADREQL